VTTRGASGGLRDIARLRKCRTDEKKGGAELKHGRERGKACDIGRKAMQAMERRYVELTWLIQSA
jgi:hypothetical protein